MGQFRVEAADDTLILLIDRPPVNALTADLLEAGAVFLEEIAGNPPAGGVVLSGAGDTFTAGVDRKVVADADRDYRRRLVWAVNRFAAALYRLPCALVSAVNGHAVGAGGIMCLASDWTLAADGPAKIGLPEAKAGLPFPRVPQIIMAHAMDPVWRRRLALSSMLLLPPAAIASGLVDEVTAADRLVDAAIARARDMQAQPGFAVVKADLRRAALAEIDAVFAARADPLADQADGA
jgi:enoyl-CoA hydratase/carnithine racemase